MVKFECTNCSYKTNHKAKFDAHINRKIPCNKYNTHKNIKTNNTFYCEKCSKTFSRNDSLQRHNKIFHVDIHIGGNSKQLISGNNNILSNSKQLISGNNNTLSNSKQLIS